MRPGRHGGMAKLSISATISPGHRRQAAGMAVRARPAAKAQDQQQVQADDLRSPPPTSFNTPIWRRCWFSRAERVLVINEPLRKSRSTPAPPAHSGWPHDGGHGVLALLIEVGLIDWRPLFSTRALTWAATSWMWARSSATR